MKDIRGYENEYAITEDGKVWSYKVNRFLATGTDRDGYERVRLRKCGKEKSCTVHRLVSEAYLPNPDNLPEVNHIDENKLNNNINNLEWCTRQQNCKHSAHQKYKPVYCVELDTIYESIGAAINYTGAKQITACLNGRQNTAGGYHWRYA